MKDVHLNDEQFAGLLLGSEGGDAEAHVAGCAECRSELERFRGSMSLLSRHTRATAERPAGFWYAQRRQVAERLGERPAQSRLMTWAAAMAVLLFMAVMLGQVSIQPQLLATEQSGTGTQFVDPDDVLMAEIQASVRRTVPRAFEPALLVTQELNRAAEIAQAQP